MRRLTLILLPLVVIAFYAGSAGAYAAPYYGAVTGLLHSVADRQFAPAPTAMPTPRARGVTRRKTAAPTPRPPVTPTPPARATGPRPHAGATPSAGVTKANTLNKSRLIAAVQRLGANKTPRRRTNILILGSDNDQKFASYAAPLTQVMIVLSIDPVSRSVTLLSIPRDFYVRIPGYTYNLGPDGTVGWSKIDVASKLGFDSAACTVERNFGVPVDGWVWVGLSGFTHVIDTIHGVTLDVTHPVIDDNYPDDLANPDDPYAYRRIYIPPGPQHLYGDAALHFVRSRHGDAQGDFGRSGRQQILLTQLRRTLQGEDATGLWASIPTLLTDFHNEAKTDLPTDLPSLARYLSLFREAAHYPIKQVVLSPPYSTPEYWITDNDPQVVSQAGHALQEDAVLPNWPRINAEIQTLFGGQYNAAPHCAAVSGAGAGR